MQIGGCQDLEGREKGKYYNYLLSIGFPFRVKKMFWSQIEVVVVQH